MRLCCGFIAARRWSADWPGALASAGKLGNPSADAALGEASTTWQLAPQPLASSAPRSGLWADATPGGTQRAVTMAKAVFRMSFSVRLGGQRLRATHRGAGRQA